MLVGLVGFISSGKGTAGSILEDCGFKGLSFADPLKDATANIFGWPRAMLEGDTPESRVFREAKDEYWSAIFGRPFTPREALQKIGTEAIRKTIHPDIWIHALVRRLAVNSVIKDVRFFNEIEFIHQNQGIIIQIQRDNLPDWWDIARIANIFPKAEDGIEAAKKMEEIGIHNSEWNWIGGRVDYVLQNDGTILDLRIKLYDVIMNTFNQKLYVE